MTRIKPFDPVVVREQRARLVERSSGVAEATVAADALLWFNEYAFERDDLRVITVGAGVAATATHNADLATKYVNGAAKRLAPDILKLAIEMAKADYDAALKKAAA